MIDAVPDVLLQADTWRIVSAAVSVLVLFLLTVGLRLHGHRLPTSWRRVLRAVTLQQALLAYVAVVRAQATPDGFPEARVDVSLALVVLSGVALLVAVIGVFLAEHHD